MKTGVFGLAALACFAFGAAQAQDDAAPTKEEAWNAACAEAASRFAADKDANEICACVIETAGDDRFELLKIEDEDGISAETIKAAVSEGVRDALESCGF